MNYKLIVNIIGRLLFIEGFFMSFAILISLIYGEQDVTANIISTCITVSSGAFLYFITRKKNSSFGKKEGYVIVSLAWIIFSFFGALPFYISGEINSYTNCFFETMSGFTTTGASILNDIESMSHGLLFWRSIIQWLGGMGIIVLSLAILPFLGIGGIQLFIAEVPGLKPDKLHPKVKETAKRLWGIYLFFTLAEVILLWIGGMDFFDAINHSFTTLSTGGYSTKQASIAYWDSPFIQYVIIFFMILGGMNFTLAYFALKRQFRKVWSNEELKHYLSIILGATLIIMISLIFTKGLSTEVSFRESLFQVVSIMTTTGYATVDYLSWTSFLVVILFILMFFGGSAGSTGGSIKIVRISLVLKNSYQELKRLIHPNAVIPVRFNKKTILPQSISNVLSFIVLYIVIFVFGTLIMSALGLDLESSMGAVAATLGNIGPGIGSVGPAENYFHIPDVGKWILSFFMLLGRLELFTVLIILTPSFWRK